MASTAPSTSPTAQEIGERAADWIQRRQFWEWSEADQAEFDAWLAQSPAHLVAYLRLEATWARTDRLTALDAPLKDDVSQKRPLSFFVGIAAALIFAVVGIAFVGASKHPHDRVFSTPVGGHELISFADGSTIELNTNTVLRTRMTTEQKTIWLDQGEVYFQIKHDRAHPLVVVVGGHRVVDIGTKFLIRRDPAHLEVALLEGRVRFGDATARRQEDTTLLKPGDVVTATPGTMFITHETARDLADRLSWRRSVLVFHHTTLATAATEFNRYNRRQLVIADPTAAALTIDGTFPTTGISDFSKLAQIVLGLRVENHGNEIVIDNNR